MVELPLLGPEIRVQIPVRTYILSNSNRLYRLCYTNNKKPTIALASNCDPAIGGSLVGGDK